jgi:hypothetical protein
MLALDRRRPAQPDKLLVHFRRSFDDAEQLCNLFTAGAEPFVGSAAD